MCKLSSEKDNVSLQQTKGMYVREKDKDWQGLNGRKNTTMRLHLRFRNEFKTFVT